MAQRQRGEALLANGRDREAALLYQKMYMHKDSTFPKDVRMLLDELNTLFQVDEIRMKGQLDRSRFVILIIGLIMLVTVAPFSCTSVIGQRSVWLRKTRS